MENSYKSYLNSLLKAVCETLGVSTNDVKSGSRKTPLPDARRAFCYLAVKNDSHKYSLEQIGEAININHDMVTRHRDKAADFMIYEKPFSNLVMEVKLKLDINDFKNVAQL